MRLLFAVTFLAVGTMKAADPAPPTAKLNYLTIGRPAKDFAPELAGSPYTNVGVLAALPQRTVICLDPNASKITFTDDKGTNLVAAPVRSGLYPAVRTDATKSQVHFTISTTKVPAEGATKLRVKGNLVFLCGVGEKTATADSLVIRDKEKLTLGPATFEVSLGGNRTFINMTADPLVKSISLLDKDGKTVATLPFYLTINADGKLVQSGSAAVPPNTQAVSVKVVHYEKSEPATVPIDAEIGVGG